MPVGTRGTVKGILPAQLKDTGAQCVLNNTYHLMLRPGSEAVARRGGVHRFMCWDGPILTDSGGYQAYSMADINAVDEDGVTFKSILTGENIRLTPEISMRVQNLLGPDIIMAFDDCPPSVDPQGAPANQTRLRLAAMRDSGNKTGYSHDERLDLALERTTRWLHRCKAAHTRPDEQALFGIVQGGVDLQRRAASVEQICDIDLPGYAIGGVAVGESGDEIRRVVRFTAPRLPADKPRYLMGVGYAHDIVAAVCAGVDMFDCVLPTRNGRNANAFLSRPDDPDELSRAEGGPWKGQIRLRNARYADDDRPLEPGCDCPACDPAGHGWPSPEGTPFTRAYIRHLFLCGEMLGPILVSLHNLRFYQRLMIDVRLAVANDDWLGLARRWPGAAAGLPEHLPGAHLPSSNDGAYTKRPENTR
ncbi:MAG TPA: tRNA guanosine(34) transglycosylase Tgt [Phycisphaerales bacterium]|nr:tRNA guanosine(34) transglycosylase Tgt [Phycisphaerales bacterium]